MCDLALLCMSSDIDTTAMTCCIVLLREPSGRRAHEHDRKRAPASCHGGGGGNVLQCRPRQGERAAWVRVSPLSRRKVGTPPCCAEPRQRKRAGNDGACPR